MLFSRASAACRRILVPPGRASCVVLDIVVRGAIPMSDRRPSSSFASFSVGGDDDDDDGPSRSDRRRRRRRRRLHVGFEPSLFDSHPPRPSSSSSSSSSQPTEDDDVGEPSDARLVDAMATALRGGVSSFDCPAPPSSLVAAGDGGVGEGRYYWRGANRIAERRIASALDRALEMTSDSRRGADGNGRDGVVTLTSRLGFRMATTSPASGGVADDGTAAVLGGDDEGEDDRDEGEGTFEGDSRVGTTTTSDGAVLVHNLGEDYVLHSLRTSPLVRRYRLNDVVDGSSSVRDDGTRIRLISLAHDPETQVAARLSSTTVELARERMRRRLTSAFVGYEIAVGRGWIDGYGVDSNGLGLPETHEMHVDWRDVLGCAGEAYLEASTARRGVDGGGGGDGRSSLRVIRLPGNLLETRGLAVADEIRSFMRSAPSPSGRGESPTSVADDEDDDAARRKERRLRTMRDALPESLDVIVTRPLAAYPHGGTGGVGPDNAGDVHPVRLVDYRIEEKSSPPIWSNEHNVKYGIRPATHQPILNAALSHFDAYDILEESRDRELTVEERETLDGCKLLRDMLHDMDASLDATKSFDAYESHLMNVAVPLIYGTFEELDEESARILELFFKAHGTAVRMAVARWTRDLLLAGWKRIPPATKDGNGDSTWEKVSEKERIISSTWKSYGFSNFNGGYAVPDDVTLQEFAFTQLLKAEGVGGIVVGCSSPEHVLEALRAADSSCADLDKEREV